MSHDQQRDEAQDDGGPDTEERLAHDRELLEYVKITDANGNRIFTGEGLLKLEAEAARVIEEEEADDAKYADDDGKIIAVATGELYNKLHR